MTENCVSNQLSLVPYVNRVVTIGTSYVPHLLCHKMMIFVTGDENCQFSGDNKISKKKTADTINILKKIGILITNTAVRTSTCTVPVIQIIEVFHLKGRGRIPEEQSLDLIWVFTARFIQKVLGSLR